MEANSAGLADAVLGVHAAFVLFVVGGQALVLTGWARGWSWTRNRIFRTGHLLAIGFVVATTWLGIACPLTVLESGLRAGAGYEAGFIQYWLGRALYWDFPGWVFVVVYSLFGALVALTFFKYPPGAGKERGRR